jgi:hypothetical protein
MHTNLYLNSNTHHHPSNKEAVLSTLVHRTRCLFVTRRACILNWSFSGPLSGRTAAVTERSNGLLTHQKGKHCPWRNPPQSPSCPMSHDFEPHQQAAVHVCLPTPKEDPQFPSACKGRLETQDSWCAQHVT